jgi:hypothetical protein
MSQIYHFLPQIQIYFLLNKKEDAANIPFSQSKSIKKTISNENKKLNLYKGKAKTHPQNGWLLKITPYSL